MAYDMGGALFKRCVQCPNETPTCPDCAQGEICSLVPQSCDDCAHMTCIANPNPSPTDSKPNVGAIAGGVIGGVLFIGVAIFLFWRFWIKKRREQQEQEEWDEDDIVQQKTSHFNAMRADNASTKTRGSVAASILSRASNIIHIAYIPGVTNRNGSGHNSLLAPVPPIPAAYANKNSPNTTPKSPLSNAGDALFFRPGSTYSDASSVMGKRDTQYTTHSITPSLARSSVMSDVYRDDATNEPMPATQVIRALPRMVSVKSSAASSSSMETPPSSSPGGLKVQVPGSGSSSPASQGGGQFAKATKVTVGPKNKGRPALSRTASDSSTATAKSTKPAKSSPLIDAPIESDDDSDRARARRSSSRNSTTSAGEPAPLIQPLESPFYDATEIQTSASFATQLQRPNPYAAMSASVGSGPRRAPRNNIEARGLGGLSAVMEEAAKRASAATETDVEVGKKRDQSPFGDEHAAR